MASAKALDPLEKLQNSPYRAHTTPLFGKLTLLKLKSICTPEIAKKCITIKQILIFTQVVPYPKFI